MKRILSLVFLALLAGCSSTPKETYLGYEVVELPIVIKGGEVLPMRVTNAGPIPASANGYKMQFAGFSVKAKDAQPDQAEITWGIAFDTENSEEIAYIKVEDLSDPAALNETVTIENPEVINGYWKHNFVPQEASQAATPWIFSGKASFFVFRITIVNTAGQETVLEQLMWMSKQVLANYARQITLIEKS
uniref:hypothetical protein n=1 Tax=Thaumasiovibrio occultus TaxID=1891184 RepID=UPI000B36358F|nr:hypothetical protein [Thaumasiovibrio occultus]